MNQTDLELDLEYLRDADFAKLRTEALRWAKIVRDNPSKPDGYPSRASGSDPGAGGTPPVELDEDGNPYTPGGSTTERAAIAKPARDRINMLTNVAVQQIRQAADSYRKAMSSFSECERIQSDTDLNPKPECHFMRLRADVFEESLCKTDFAGYLKKPLTEPTYVCRWVYDFTRDVKRLPNRDECRQHAQGRTVRVAA